jgi:hypothetical protein
MRARTALMSSTGAPAGSGACAACCVWRIANFISIFEFALHRVALRPQMSRSLTGRRRRLQAVDEVRRALSVSGRGEYRAVVCGENVELVGDVGGVVLARLKRQIKIGTEKRAPSSVTSSSIAFPSDAKRLVPKSRARRDSCAVQLVVGRSVWM